MFEVIMKKKADNYYNLTLISNDKSHYINIYINNVDDAVGVLISKSEDGFYFKSPCDEANDLELQAIESLEKTYNYVKTHFINKGYTFDSHHKD